MMAVVDTVVDAVVEVDLDVWSALRAFLVK